MRVASLLPSATEIVCLLGAEAELVGRSHECDYPAAVRELPVMTRPRVGGTGSSAEIDRDVRRLLEDALAIYELDLAALADARPELVITQDLCDVCAVSLGQVRRAAEELLGPSTRLVSLRPERLSAVWEDVRRVAVALGRAAQGESAVAALERRVAELSKRVPSRAVRPKVLSLEWLEPVMVGGLWMPELIELSGGAPLVTRAGERAPTLGTRELEALEPDVVLLKPCGFTLEQTLGERARLREQLPWTRWRAVREGRVFVADGSAYFNRSGPRLVESLEILAACLYPEVFDDYRTAHAASVRRLTPELEAVRA